MKSDFFEHYKFGKDGGVSDFSGARPSMLALACSIYPPVVIEKCLCWLSLSFIVNYFQDIQTHVTVEKIAQRGWIVRVFVGKSLGKREIALVYRLLLILVQRPFHFLCTNSQNLVTDFRTAKHASHGRIFL